MKFLKISFTPMLLAGCLPALIPLGLRAQCTINGPASSCAGEVLTFEVDGPQAGSTYEWDFDADGQVDATGLSVEHRFPGSETANTYRVTLLRDGTACDDLEVNVSAGPDASLGVNPADGTLENDEIRVCTKDKKVTVGFFNTSTTISINQSYEINWGDGSVEVFDNNTFTPSTLVEHTYTEQGFKQITLRVTATNGCVAETQYLFYYGGNPSVGLVNPGNTTGLCVGDALTFPISETGGNPEDTEYEIYINDVLIESFTQTNLPADYTYVFDESSCGLSTPSANFKHAFEVKMLARTPCGTSSASIAPIEVSAPPQMDLTIDAPSNSCTGEVFRLRNTSVTQEITNDGTASQCQTSLIGSWNIDGPGGFNIINGTVFGSEELEVAFDVPGVYGVTVTVTSAYCGAFSITDSLVVDEVVPPIEAGDISADFQGANVCAPSTVTFNNSLQGASNFAWQVSPAQGWSFTGGTDGSSQVPSIEFTEGGTYILELTAANDCSSEQWVDTILVNGTPSVGLAPLPDFCEQAQLNFDASSVQYEENGNPITAYAWSFPGAATPSSTDPFPTAIEYTAPGTYTVDLTASNSCGSRTATATFEVEAPIDAIVDDTLTFCGNTNPFTLNANPGGGIWTGNGVDAQGRFDPAQAVTGDNWLVYEIGIGACADKDSTLVRLFPVPQVDVGQDLTACANVDSLTLTANLAGGSWTASGGVLANDRFLPAQSGPGNYQLIYQVTDANSCSAADTLQVAVNALPQLITGDTFYCNVPGSFDLPPVNLSGGIWSGPGISGNAFSPQLAGGPGNYPAHYTYTDANSCTDSVSINIQVDPLALVDAGPDDSLCVTATPFQPTGLPAGGVWSGPGISTANPDVFDPARAGAGSHLLVYSIGAGSCRNQDSVLITLLANPVVDAGPDRQVCAEDPPFVLGNNSPVGGDWTGPGVTNSVSGTFDPAQVPLGTTQLVYGYSFPGLNCFGYDTIQVAKRPLPNPIFQAPATFCQGDTLRLLDNSVGASSWNWNFGDGDSTNVENPVHVYDTSGQFRIRLEVENTFGCSDTTSRLLEVIDTPLPAFTMDTDNGCAPVTVNFTNQTTGPDPSYEWDFGIGQTSSQETPPAITFFSAPRDTIFQVRLRATNRCGFREFVDTVQVLTVPGVNFGFNVDTSCSPLAVQISNLTSGGIVDVFWDLGNGNTSRDFNPPEQVYRADDQPITYNIKLRASNICGLDSLTRPLVVNPANVEAFISVPNQRGCAPYAVDFTSFTTIGSRLVWNFGDGTSSTERDPTHVYDQPGTYQVVQFAENGCGVDTTSTLITVIPAPEAQFEIPDLGCVGQEVLFNNLSTGADGYQWRFDSLGTASVVNPRFTFGQTGNYRVRLTAIDGTTGCRDTFSLNLPVNPVPDVDLQAGDSLGCAPLEVSFQATSSRASLFRWDFGDGNSSGLQGPTHRFVDGGTYEVTVTAIDSLGCSQASRPLQVLVRPKPQLYFSPKLLEDCTLPARVTMDDQSTEVDTYAWTFGNGEASALRNPTAVYAAPGTYPIRLRGSTIYGCVDSLDSRIEVPMVPVAAFDYDPAQGCSPLEVQFTNLSTMADDYLWAFGDGTFSTEADPVHIYLEKGEYDLRLIASAGGRCRDTLEVFDAVRVFGTPFASFVARPKNTQPFDGTFIFENTSRLGESYFWDFGDGTTSTEFSPEHQFSENRETRQIYLEVIGENGCRDDTLMVFIPPAIKGLHIPTGFSPESGLGDVRLFKPTGTGLREYHIQVFSSYGEMLWESTLLEDGQPVESWDGTVNGQLQPQDVYVWKCRATFIDGTVWAGQKDAAGNVKNIGSLVLLR